jgi:hypothetical protein
MRYERPVEILYSRIDWLENSSRRVKGLLLPDVSDMMAVLFLLTAPVDIV